MFVKRLLSLADEARKRGDVPLANPQDVTAPVTATVSLEESKEHVTAALRAELQRLQQHKDQPFKKLGFSQEKIDRILEHPEEITPEEWQSIKQAKNNILIKEEIARQAPEQQTMNETLVEEERRKHINKRFNIRDGWLPLK